MDIDFVVPWVNSEDPEWQDEKRKYAAGNSYGDSEERFRDWNLMRYWFRCALKNAPWVRKIHFIVWKNVPDWLDTSDPKLSVVKHEDFLPEEARPCFNSSLLERYLHLIPDLSEHFVYFNDDLFLLGPVSEDYFFKNGLPEDMLALQPVVANPSNPGMSHLFLNNSLVLARHFDKKSTMRAHRDKFFHFGYPLIYFGYNLLELFFPKFTGLYSVHSAAPLLKSVFEKVWEEEGEYLRSLDKNRFREDTDVNQYLFREWGKLEGRFVPSNVTRHAYYTEISEDDEALVRLIKNGGKRVLRSDVKCLCINDCGGVRDKERICKDLTDAFDTLYGTPCSFELK